MKTQNINYNRTPLDVNNPEVLENSVPDGIYKMLFNNKDLKDGYNNLLLYFIAKEILSSEEKLQNLVRLAYASPDNCVDLRAIFWNTVNSPILNTNYYNVNYYAGAEIFVKPPHINSENVIIAIGVFIFSEDDDKTIIGFTKNHQQIFITKEDAKRLRQPLIILAWHTNDKPRNDKSDIAIYSQLSNNPKFGGPFVVSAKHPKFPKPIINTVGKNPPTPASNLVNNRSFFISRFQINFRYENTGKSELYVVYGVFDNGGYREQSPDLLSKVDKNDIGDSFSSWWRLYNYISPTFSNHSYQIVGCSFEYDSWPTPKRTVLINTPYGQKDFKVRMGYQHEYYNKFYLDLDMMGNGSYVDFISNEGKGMLRFHRWD